MLTCSDLVGIATVIRCAAASRNWQAGSLDDRSSGTIQEVQCLAQGSRLLIAGNEEEHKQIRAFLNAGGVRDLGTLRNCLMYAHWVLDMPHGDRNAKLRFASTLKYSTEEKVNAAQIKKVVPPLLDWQAERATKLLTERTTQIRAGEKHLGWFLRKLAGGTGPNDNQFVKGSGSVEDAAKPVYVVAGTYGTAPHAELKLLAHVTRELLKQTATAAPFCLGGLKRACKYCKSWMTELEWFLKARFNITVQHLTGDERPEGSGAGSRPSLTTADNVAGTENGAGRYLKRMFNGQANGICRDLAECHNDGVLWKAA